MNFDFLISQFGTLTATGLEQGAIYALVALGYTLVYGVLQLINFAHSEVFLVGTVAMVVVWNWLGFSGNAAAPGLAMTLALLMVALLAAALTSAGVAVVIERVAYRPLRRRNAPRLVFLITAIGASVVIAEFIGVLTHRRPLNVPSLITQTTLFEIPGFSILGYDVAPTPITNLEIGIVGAAIVMMVVLDLFINKTRLGRGVRAVAQDPDTAALMGVNKDRVILITFLLGGLMAGGAAVLYMLKIASTTFNVGFLLGIKAFTAAVLGGIGNLRGALLGGLLLGVVENYGAAIFGNQWKDATAFIVLVVILMFRPTGLLGESLGRARA